jgi:hypothetical protein
MQSWERCLGMFHMMVDEPVIATGDTLSLFIHCLIQMLDLSADNTAVDALAAALRSLTSELRRALPEDNGNRLHRHLRPSWLLTSG